MAESPHHRFSTALRCVLATAFLAGCAREDEELQRQVVELRAEVQAKTKELEDLRTKTPVTPPVTSQQPTTLPPSSAELSKAQARIGELESEIAKLNSKLSSQAKPQPEVPASISMKFDADVLKDKLEDDLTHKASELRELVLRQNGVSGISEISIKRVELPPEVITPFHSAITFTLVDNGKPLRVQFPVTADFGGSWRLPSPDKIQQACQQAREQMAANPPAATTDTSPVVPTPAPAATSHPMAPQSVPAHTPSMKRVDANTFVMDWGDKPSSGGAAPAPSAPSSTPTAPASPASGSGTRAASGQGAAPANVPPPVMPVQRDIIIKF